MPSADPMTDVLSRFRLPEATDFADGWVGLEPTFQTKKSVRRWAKYSQTPEGEVAYFNDKYMLKTQKNVARGIRDKYRALHATKRSCCMFDRVKLEPDFDQWGVTRQNLRFYWADESLPRFTVRFTLDPETFEYSIKPVPLAWLYDARFVEFMEEFLFQVPLYYGLAPSIGHGGAQFSFSAKCFLGGSLLADDIAYRLNHPELAVWVTDYPNCDDRALRSTRPRFEACRDLVKEYWAGAFHPQATGTLTVANAFRDQGFFPAKNPPRGLIHAKTGPVGTPQEVFQTNFVFGRAFRLLGQNVDPGYWQSAHPHEDGYRPDQIMRYSEVNLNRLQIAGEFHVKSGNLLTADRIPEYDAPLDISMLYDEASYEDRAQMSRTSARDLVEAILLNVHHARYLMQSPRVKVVASLLQDQLMVDGEKTFRKHASAEALASLRSEARETNASYSNGRVKSDWIEPETLLWANWRVLPAAERGAIAREVVTGFLGRVREAASVDPRKDKHDDPMEWHRHRIHPAIWRALIEAPEVLGDKDDVAEELRLWRENRDLYLARRPVYSVAGFESPWDDLV